MINTKVVVLRVEIFKVWVINYPPYETSIPDKDWKYLWMFWHRKNDFLDVLQSTKNHSTLKVMWKHSNWYFWVLWMIFRFFISSHDAPSLWIWWWSLVGTLRNSQYFQIQQVRMSQINHSVIGNWCFNLQVFAYPG